MGVEETARLIVEAEAKGFADTDAKIQRTEGSLDALTRGYQAGAFPLDYYLERGHKLQSELDQLRDSYRMAEDALKKYGSTQAASAALTSQVSSASAQARIRTQSLAYAFNDFFSVSGNVQQRLNAIANNLPGLFAGLGPKLAGFGLALGAIAPIIGMVIANWDTLGKKVDDVLGGIVGSENWEGIKKAITDSFGGAVKEAVDRLDELKAKAKELDDKKHKVEMDYIGLQHTKEEIDKITEGLQLIEQLKRHQSKEQKESGQTVETAIAESKAGAEKVIADLSRDFQREMVIDPNNALGVTRRQLAETSKEIAKQSAKASELELAGQAPAAASVRGRVEDLKKELAALEKKQNDQTAEITKKGGLADQEAGKLLAGAERGVGPAQARDQEEVKRRLAAAGHADVAGQISGAKELEAYDKEVAEFQRHMDAATAAGDRRRRLEAQKEKAQQTALDTLLKSNTFDEEADAAAKEVNKKGLTKLESFEALKAKIQADILDSLRKQGKAADNAERVAAKAAASEAERAFTRVGTEGQKEKKKEETAEKKADAAWVAEQTKTLEADIAETTRRQTAEAGRIHQDQGKDAGNPYFFNALAADPTGDPEKIVAKVAAKMVEYFTRSKNLGGLGATQGGAQIAAQQYAAQAGFRLTIPQIREAGIGVARDARNPAAAAERDAREQKTREARERLNADRQQRADANKQLKRANAVPVARANAPKASQPATPKPGGFVLPTEADTLKRRQAEDKAKAAQPKPQPPPPVKKASLDQTLDQVAHVQGVVSEGLAIDAQLATRLAVINQRTQTLEGMSRGILTRLNEQQPTASNTGGNTG